MSRPVSTERRLLTGPEFEAVQVTHFPAIRELSREALIDVAKRVREFRDKARDVARQQRREMRGKAAPRGARPSRDNTGTAMKAQIFAGALKRLNQEIRRADEAVAAEGQPAIARRALAMKRRNRVRHHPAAGRTADAGMRPVDNPGPTVEADPREVGRVSQFVKAAQARRDS